MPESLLRANLRKVPIEGKVEIKKGEPLAVAVKDYNGNEVQIDSDIYRGSNKQASHRERVLEQLQKQDKRPLNFEYRSGIESGLAVPVSELNTIRRKALSNFRLKGWTGIRRKQLL